MENVFVGTLPVLRSLIGTFGDEGLRPLSPPVRLRRSGGLRPPDPPSLQCLIPCSPSCSAGRKPSDIGEVSGVAALPTPGRLEFKLPKPYCVASPSRQPSIN